MKINYTRSAKLDLKAIYKYHREYDPKYASDFNRKIIKHIWSHLRAYPKIWVLINETKAIHRLIYQGYCIYYVMRDEAIFILHIISELQGLNSDLKQSDVKLPSLK